MNTELGLTDKQFARRTNILFTIAIIGLLTILILGVEQWTN